MAVKLIISSKIFGIWWNIVFCEDVTNFHTENKAVLGKRRRLNGAIYLVIY